MATNTSPVKGKAPKRGRDNSLDGVRYAIAQFEETLHIINQAHRRVDNEISKYLIVMDSLLYHRVPERTRKILAVYS